MQNESSDRVMFTHLQAIEPWSVSQRSLWRSPMLLLSLLLQALLLFALLRQVLLLLLLLLLDLQLGLQVLLLLHVLHLRRHAEALGQGWVQTLRSAVRDQHSDLFHHLEVQAPNTVSEGDHQGPHACVARQASCLHAGAAMRVFSLCTQHDEDQPGYEVGFDERTPM